MADARQVWTCPECGPCVAADEDGCCAMCGADCKAESFRDALAAAEARGMTRAAEIVRAMEKDIIAPDEAANAIERERDKP